MVKIICTKEDCKHEWNYKGKSKFYVTCPSCYRKLNIKSILKEVGDDKKEN